MKEIKRIKLLALGILLLSSFPIQATSEEPPHVDESTYYQLTVLSGWRGLVFGPLGENEEGRVLNFAHIQVINNLPPLNRKWWSCWGGGCLKGETDRRSQNSPLIQVMHSYARDYKTPPKENKNGVLLPENAHGVRLDFQSEEGALPQAVGRGPINVGAFQNLTRLNLCDQLVDLQRLCKQLREFPKGQFKELILDEAKETRRGWKTPKRINDKTSLPLLAQLEGLLYLSLRGCRLETIGDIPSSLMSLDLSENTSLKGKAPSFLTIVCSSKTYPQLRALNLAGCKKIENRHMRELFRVFSKVEHLSLRGTDISNRGSYGIIRALQNSLRSLDLSYTNVDVEESYIRRCCPVLAQLKMGILSYNEESTEKIV